MRDMTDADLDAAIAREAMGWRAGNLTTLTKHWWSGDGLTPYTVYKPGKWSEDAWKPHKDFHQASDAARKAAHIRGSEFFDILIREELDPRASYVHVEYVDDLGDVEATASTTARALSECVLMVVRQGVGNE
jgi:hypothetical protein